MGIFDRSHRHAIWTQAQHPFKHTLSDLAFSHPAAPGVSNIQSAFNWLFAVLYPNSKPAVANPAALPLIGNTLADYRVVTDDGDGKSAAYRWEQREGDVAAKWYKIYDVDWSTDSILAAFMDITNDIYVVQDGKQDLDEDGDPITGLYAGQKIYGGTQATQNLTLNSNSGDGVGAQTGFVQIDSPFRPTLHNTYDLSTATERWKDGYFAGSLIVGTLTLAAASITDSSGTISLNDDHLTTSGNITGGILTGSSLVADDTTDTVTLVPGSYTDTSGAVGFGAATLTTTGSLNAGVTTLTKNTRTLIFDPDNGSSQASITGSFGTISFDNEHLVTTGNITGGVLTANQLNVDNLRLDGSTISSTDVNGNINISPDGTGIINFTKVIAALGTGITGTLTVTGQADIDNLRLDGNTLSSINVNGDINLTPNGTGNVLFSNKLLPSSSGSQDIGSSSALLNDVYLSGGIRNATLEMPIGTLLAFRVGIFRDLAATIPAQTGDSLFYDSVNGVWLASTPDSEVDHTTISGLTTGDAGHTQFAMLAGRAGGQSLIGGTAASETLTLESTAHATKGSVLTKDDFLPFTNASYSGGWSGIDLGGSSNNFNDVYTKGEFKGFRLENFTFATLPASSGQNIGRTMWATDLQKAYVDTGASIKVLGVSKFISDLSFNGTDIQKDTDVSSAISDARNSIWQLMDNANSFEILHVKITATSASNVRIDTDIPLPAGSYRLIGVE